LIHYEVHGISGLRCAGRRLQRAARIAKVGSTTRFERPREAVQFERRPPSQATLVCEVAVMILLAAPASL